jgi:hypothetical protein
VSANTPGDRKGNLKSVGGSSSDSFNREIANQATQVLWVKNSSPEQRDKQLSGIAPKDELEGMIAGQLIASHNAAMECYRRAMIGEQSFEGRRENLNQANKCSRTYAALLEALNRHRGKGQQKVVVEHVNVHAGGQAVVGNVEKMENNPMQSKLNMHLASRCQARSKRSGLQCRSPPVRGSRVCRMHGAAGGAPKDKARGDDSRDAGLQERNRRPRPDGPRDNGCGQVGTSR